jgi:dTMP kinase
LFIAIEGTDGSGKTTIRKHIYATLREQGLDVLSIQGQCWLIPAHTAVITRAKFHGVRYPADVLTAAAVGDKEALSDRILRPHLAWRHVVSDRYMLSDMVYHAALWGVPMEVTWRAFAASRVRRPDVFLYVDTPPELAWARVAARPATLRHPWDDAPTQARLYELFQRALRFPGTGRVHRVDNSGALARTLDQLSAWLRGAIRLADTGCPAPGGQS